MRGKVCTAATSDGAALAVDMASGELVLFAADGVRHSAAMIYVPRISNFAFIFCEIPGPPFLSTRGHRADGPVLVVRRRPMPGGLCALFNIPYRTYLTADLQDLPGHPGVVRFGADEVGERQIFKLAEVPENTLSTAISGQTALIERVLVASPVAVLDLLLAASTRDQAIISSLLMTTFSMSDTELFVDHLLADPQGLRLIAELFPGDPWATRALPALGKFLQARRARATLRPLSRQNLATPPEPVSNYMTIGPEFDRLASDGSPGNPLSFTHRCAVIGRSKVAPVKDICIIATARNDGPYLLNWVAYHRAIGVEKVFLYTNDNIDGSDRLLRALADADEVTLIESTVSLHGASPVSKAYGHALSIVPEILDYRWCAIIDSDEFIGVDRHLFESLGDYLAWQELQDVDVIGLNWVMLGSSGAVRWRNEPLQNRFQEKYLDVHVKSIFRPRSFHHASPHFPYTHVLNRVICRNANGQPHPPFSPHSSEPRDNPAWIAHFFFRSVEEFIWKFSRGRGDLPMEGQSPLISIPDQFAEMFVKQHCDMPMVKDDRLLRFSPESERELARLRKLPGIAKYSEEIENFYRKKSGLLDEAVRGLYLKATPKQAAFYDLLINS